MFYSKKTVSDFIADIGGHLGLFLGWSCFTLVEFLQGYLAERQRIRKKVKALEDKEKGNSGTNGQELGSMKPKNGQANATLDIEDEKSV